MNREEACQGITMEDVWGKCTDHTSSEPFKRLTNGMMVARGLPYEEGSPEALKIQNATDAPILPQRCPVWGDILPYKSVTVICEEKDYTAVTNWLSYVHGGGPSREKLLPEGKIAIRSDYQAW